MATFMSALLGCNAIDDKAIKPIEEGLSKKYGKKFTVSALGDRIGRDTATAYVYADDDPTMRFVTRVNKEGEIVFENYAYRLVCRRVETIVNDTFLENGLNTECYAEFMKCKLNIPEGISIEDYIKDSEAESVDVAIIIKSDVKITGESLKKIYEVIYSQMFGISVGFNLFVLSEEDYDIVYENVRNETQYFGLPRLKLSNIKGNVKKFYAKMSSNQLSLTVYEINKKLSKEED